MTHDIVQEYTSIVALSNFGSKALYYSKHKISLEEI